MYLQRCLVVTCMVPFKSNKTAAVSAHILCTPCTSLQWHFIWSHLHWVHVCSAVSWHPRFWQNDLDLLCGTTVTQIWIETEISQHKKLTMVKTFFLQLHVELEPKTFGSWVWHSTTELSLLCSYVRTTELHMFVLVWLTTASCLLSVSGTQMMTVVFSWTEFLLFVCLYRVYYMQVWCVCVCVCMCVFLSC